MSSVELILDSGAFSAWRLGDTIDLRAYIEYVKRYGHLFKAYVCLDTIPGSYTRSCLKQKWSSAHYREFRGLLAARRFE